MSKFQIPVRVYHEDTDGGGIVYYANYLRFMERARTEFLRSLGYEQDVLAADSNRMFVVTHCTVSYRQPARFNELLQVSAVPTAWRRASMEFEQVVSREDTTTGNSQPAILCEGTIRLACLDSETYKPAAMPPELIAAVDNPGT